MYYGIYNIQYFNLLAILFTIITVGIVAVTFIFLHQKKRKFLAQKVMAEKLYGWISSIIIKDPDENIDNYITPELLIYLKTKYRRDFPIKQLINIQINLKGTAENNIIQLYNRLNLKRESLKKFYSSKWNIKAKGIYELYMMEQLEMLDEIFAETNHPNHFVRMEAQTAIISFQGFKGLKFLSTLTTPLNKWSQIKLLDELALFTPTIMDDLPLWLLSKNDYVALFALRLTEIYKQMAVHDIVVSLLHHENQNIQTQAICTLGSIAAEGTNSILKESYVNEDFEGKRQILRTLKSIQKDEDIRFFISTALEENDLLRLEAIRSLMSYGENGERISLRLQADGMVPKTIIGQAIYETKQKA